MVQPRESGQSMVFSILFLVALLGFCALLIDGGSWMWSKRSLQGDADAAALAAVRELPTNPGAAPGVAEDYVETQNSGDDAELETYTSDLTRMTSYVVVTRSAASSPFGALLSAGNAQIRARATARIAQVNSVDGLLPFAAEDGSLQYGNPPIPEAITVAPGGIVNGHIGAIAPRYSPPSCTSGTTNSAAEVEAAIESWHAGGITTCGTPVNSTVNTATGARPRAIEDGIDQRFGSLDGTHPDRFADTFTYDPALDRYILEKPESPRVGFIPVIKEDWGTIPGTSTPVTVIDYVMVYIGLIGVPGEPAYLKGPDCRPTPCPGSTIQVYVTPIRGMITPNFNYSLSSTWNAGSSAPLAITLEE